MGIHVILCPFQRIVESLRGQVSPPRQGFRQAPSLQELAFEMETALKEARLP